MDHMETNRGLERLGDVRLPSEYASIAHLVRPLIRYALIGDGLGDFLRSCVSNNFFEAIARADLRSLRHIRAIMLYIRWYIPSQSHGSADAYGKWIVGGGLAGKEGLEDATDRLVNMATGGADNADSLSPVTGQQLTADAVALRRIIGIDVIPFDVEERLQRVTDYILQ